MPLSYVYGRRRVGLLFGNMYKQTCNAFNQVISFYSLTYANFLTANRPKLYAFAVLLTAYTKSQKRLVNNCKIRELEFLLFVMIPLSSLVYDIFFAYHNS